ncbi:MAG TPA: hypothetical protein VFE05_23410 [Longimicrobiaceae bacterium]|jgi:hypothetical protein|nr:hypothetical protein [Longimicrobiaceae bacterium]
MRKAGKWMSILALAAAVAGCESGASTARSTGPTGPRLTLSSSSVSLNGPSPVHAGSTCVYYANVSGGTAPYSYSWSASGGTFSDLGDGVIEATRSTVGILNLSVTVTDANNDTASGFKTVNFTSTAPYCAP